MISNYSSLKQIYFIHERPAPCGAFRFVKKDLPLHEFTG